LWGCGFLAAPGAGGVHCRRGERAKGARVAEKSQAGKLSSGRLSYDLGGRKRGLLSYLWRKSRQWCRQPSTRLSRLRWAAVCPVAGVLRRFRSGRGHRVGRPVRRKPRRGRRGQAGCQRHLVLGVAVHHRRALAPGGSLVHFLRRPFAIGRRQSAIGRHRSQRALGEPQGNVAALCLVDRPRWRDGRRMCR
jgi:hypothetical protein